ncbi:MAG: hypothetical protein ACKV2T_42190 [Kofleriaceae bacterium]
MSARSVLAVLWIASAIGCHEDEVKRLEVLRDELCKCKTVECGEAVMQRVPVIADAGNRRSQTVARAMLGCMAKLYDSSRPQTGPDVETPVENNGSAAPATGSAASVP